MQVHSQTGASNRYVHGLLHEYAVLILSVLVVLEENT